MLALYGIAFSVLGCVFASIFYATPASSDARVLETIVVCACFIIGGGLGLADLKDWKNQLALLDVAFSGICLSLVCGLCIRLICARHVYSHVDPAHV